MKPTTSAIANAKAVNPQMAVFIQITILVPLKDTRNIHQYLYDLTSGGGMRKILKLVVEHPRLETLDAEPHLTLTHRLHGISL